MELFIDSANIKEIEETYNLGIIHGVTTNPTIISRENKKFDEVLKEITGIVKDGYIFAEVTSTKAEDMAEEGLKLNKKCNRMVIKLPMCKEGLKACKILSQKKVRVCMTLIFSETQAILAANAGALFVAPFVGRLDDIGANGVELVKEIKNIFTAQNINVKIVAASTRNIVHIASLAKCGCDIATVPYKVLISMIDHPLSVKGLEQFMKDWEKVPK